ncbi:MAG: hypothetical protein ACREOK_08975, partial [Gemmatimonadaceae bacterium]
MKAKLTVQRLLERMRDVLQLRHIEETAGLDREISSPHVSSPGLALAGYTERFASHRLQVFGETEITYLRSLDDDARRRVLKDFFRFRVPCIFITKGLQSPPGLLEEATFANVAVLCSGLKTNEFYNRIKPWLEEEFAATTSMHASLADVFGVGLLFTGRSGIGKSECVLDLVERGHRLVAITSAQHSGRMTSRHPSGRKLADFADVVLDNGAPYGDATLPLPDGGAVGAV